MPDILAETQLGLPEAARLLPGRKPGKPLHWISILRYVLKGRLEAVRVGGRWVTSREAVARMVERDTAAKLPTNTTHNPVRSQSSKRKGNEAAKRELAAMGVLP